MSAPGRPHDEGAALVIALVFVGIWGVVVGALLSLAEVGFETTTRSAQQAGGVYASEGAADLVLAHLAGDTDHGCTASPFTLELNSDRLPDDHRVHLSCTLFDLPDDERMVDLEARIGPDAVPFEDLAVHLRARALLDDTSQPAGVEVTNWVVSR